MGICIRKGVNGLRKMIEQGCQLAFRVEVVMRVHTEKRSKPS